MAHHKAALKSIRQTKIRSEHNRFFKSTMRTYIKRTRKLIEMNNLEEARTLMPKTHSIIDRCASKGIIHRNTANRYKARLSAGLNRQAAQV